MSNLTAVFVTEFDKDVKQAYVEKAMLRDTVRLKTEVEGETVIFPTVTSGMATRKTPQADVVPMNIGRAKVTATMADWNAPVYVDKFDQAKINWDDRRIMVVTSAEAIIRREDQIVIDALDNAPTTLIVDTNEGGSAYMNTAKFRKAKKYLDDKNVPPTDRFFVMSSEALYQMLGDDDANTFDKNAIKMLVEGELKKWLGFSIYTLGNMEEGGLPIDGSDVRTNFAYHRRAIGLGVGINMATSIDWIPEKTSYLVNTVYSGGSTYIDLNGIVKVEATETT